MNRHARSRLNFYVGVLTVALLATMLQCLRLSDVIQLDTIPVTQGQIVKVATTDRNSNAMSDNSLRVHQQAATGTPFLNIDGINTLDHHVYFHNVYDVHRHIRAADTIFLGNSRVLCALPDSTARDFFAPRGRQFYQLCFPGEHDTFARGILDRAAAEPEILIVNADDFFTGTISRFGYRAAHNDQWQTQKLLWESGLSHRLRKNFHRRFPHLPTLYANEQTFLVFRSAETGSWHVRARLGKTTPINSVAPKNRQIPESHRRAAREFGDYVAAQGIRLLLMYVPSAVDNLWRAEEMAKTLNAPLISPQLDGLTTSDGSHLDEASAARFATAFFTELAEFIPTRGQPSNDKAYEIAAQARQSPIGLVD